MNKVDIRQPIICVLGHVDHGKTTLLDYIRGSFIAAKESGGITQAIGATIVPDNVLKSICGDLLQKYKVDITIPGLLFIDTPGHEAFSNMRERGGSLADIAILIIDINQGVQPQTIESLKILRSFKTPFIVACNKIDKLKGWKIEKNQSFHKTLSIQSEHTKKLFDYKLLEIIAQLDEHNLISDRFDRIEDFTSAISLIPISAKYGICVSDLLVLLVGLAQKYLAKRLEIDTCYDGKGTILEVKDVTGIGSALDIILYDGCMDVGDTIVLATKDSVKTSKIKGIFVPKPLNEMRVSKDAFESKKHVTPALGVRVSVKNIEDVLAGTPVCITKYDEKIDELTKEIETTVHGIRIETEKEGIIVKADTLGALEAIIQLLKKENIPIKVADIGDISKKDIVKLAASRDQNVCNSVILGFNVKINSDAQEEAELQDLNVFLDTVIYKLIEDYQEWYKKIMEETEHCKLKEIATPAKFQILKNCIFRKSKPAVSGINVLCGEIKPGVLIMNSKGKIVGKIREIQDEGKKLKCAKENMEVAISIDGPTIGKHITEDDILYVRLTKNEIETLKELDKSADLIDEYMKILSGR